MEYACLGHAETPYEHAFTPLALLASFSPYNYSHHSYLRKKLSQKAMMKNSQNVLIGQISMACFEHRKKTMQRDEGELSTNKPCPSFCLLPFPPQAPPLLPVASSLQRFTCGY
jgi:hypothetical protein